MICNAHRAKTFRLRFFDSYGQATGGKQMEVSFGAHGLAILPQGFSLLLFSLLLFTWTVVSIVFRAPGICIFFVYSIKYFRGKTQ